MLAMLLKMILGVVLSFLAETGHEKAAEQIPPAPPPAPTVTLAEPMGADVSYPPLASAINEERIRRGLAALTPEPRLTAIAATRSREIVTDFQHGSRLAELAWLQGYRTEVVGEILCISTGTPCVSMWLDSPTHKSVMLDPRWSYIGIGTYSEGGATWAVAVFQ